ncbi:MAG TPA: hypothetical protein DEB25_08775 [Desulfobulbaceae bacterium]|nr:hypothetical protein [Desulfobulbaceae bacterium]
MLPESRSWFGWLTTSGGKLAQSGESLALCPAVSQFYALIPAFCPDFYQLNPGFLVPNPDRLAFITDCA